ncbi:MAG: cytochrome c, partial [Rhodothermales bacterium]|nr:cytochrome c [Rhodothermales bacterium]
MLLIGLFLAGCRGSTSTKPPVHVSLNMDSQEKFEAQESNPFFADSRAMRPPVDETVARDGLREDRAVYEGKLENGDFVTQNPYPITREFMLRGQERFEVFCAVCHGSAGDGNGIIMTGNYGFVRAPTYHSDALRDQSDGYLYGTIAYGVRTMPSYAQQIPVEDRWAIVAYIRALQRSQ